MNILLRIFLFPFSIIFWIIVFIRNLFYDHYIFKVKDLNSKVISIGNIISGGAGKTPFTEMTARYITSKGKFAAIVIKGYMREADDMKVAEFGYKNEEGKLTSESFSDEGMLLLENFQGNDSGRGLIVVGDDKSKAAKFVDSKFNPDVIILDDGFQHRSIQRDLDIVIINNKKDYLIPMGTMREPKHNITRADLIVLNTKFEEDSYTTGTKHKPRVTCNYVLEGFYNLKKEKLENTEITASVFCGIADPNSFKRMLETNSIKINSFMQFPDHHFFSINEIEKIIAEFKSHKSEYIITTQKDFVRIKDSEAVLKSGSGNVFKELLSNYPIYYAKIKMQISQNGQELFDKIDELLK